LRYFVAGIVGQKIQIRLSKRVRELNRYESLIGSANLPFKVFTFVVEKPRKSLATRFQKVPRGSQRFPAGFKVRYSYAYVGNYRVWEFWSFAKS
jgi:hypothetical protein